jgi:hypothetical protein
MPQRSFLFQVPGQDNFYNFESLTMKDGTPLKHKPKKIVLFFVKNDKVQECLGKMSFNTALSKIK